MKNKILTPTHIRLAVICLFAILAMGHTATFAQQTNPRAICNLLDRIGGKGASKRFITIVDTTLATHGNDTYLITSQNGKPCIKGSNVLAVATGINRYLNHVAHINLSWNRPTADFSTLTLPLPAANEQRECRADYRYYLNYCTFSYTMSTWTWERWQQEIDWMALHGINMPLQIVGLDVVWHRLLTLDLGYTPDEANRFIAGPCFQAWWGMNNLEGWGGPNPDWWYKRQARLAHNIVTRERELGISPVLPGYSGMVPSNIEAKGFSANDQGKWCAFVRPYILNPNSPAFTRLATLYYQRLAEVMGTSTYYSMDPFHEGANTQQINVPSAYAQIFDALNRANSHAKWVIQSWQWNPNQYHVLKQVPEGRLVVLDLFSEAYNHFSTYGNHDAVYCALPNFGGRTGLFGRLTKIMNDYFAQCSAHPNIKGVGAAPEAIEQVPAIYDALYELPWLPSQPDPATWLSDYTISRYGMQNSQAAAAWEKLRLSALNCPTPLQGPHEAVFCARPSLHVDYVSTWGGTDIFYNPHHVADAARLLLAAGDSLHGENYLYDLTDVCRQALTDYGNFLLRNIEQAYTTQQTACYRQRRDAYIQLMYDLDSLLCTNSMFMVGRWTNMARDIANEQRGTTQADRLWLEIANARTLITTWGPRAASEHGGLRDYSYREWGGMLKDFYAPRWKTFFECLDNKRQQPDWFAVDSTWVHNAHLTYKREPRGNTRNTAQNLFRKYFIAFGSSPTEPYYIYRHVATDATTFVCTQATRGKKFTPPLPAEVVETENSRATLSIDYNNDGFFSNEETVQGLSLNIPNTACTNRVKATMCLTDGTVFSFGVEISQ